MRIALLIPPDEHPLESSVPQDVEESRGAYPPLGLLYVAAAAEAWAHADVVLIDCPTLGASHGDVAGLVERSKASLVGMSATTFTVVDVLEAARRIKEGLPEVKIIVGGVHATLYPMETLALSPVDFVLAGEGERSFARFVEAFAAGRTEEFADIPGLGFVTEDGPVFNSPVDVIEDLDAVPPPARHLIDLSAYTNLIGMGDASTTLQSSRGCPFGCRFCDMRRSKFRARSAEGVVDEIEALTRQGIDDLFFVDDTITVDRKRLRRICDLICERGIKVHFKISARADTLEPDILAALKRAGCYRIHIGVESGTPRLLDILDKNVTVSRMRQAFADARTSGIETFAYCMIGIPTETRDEMLATARYAVSLGPRYAQFSVCTPYPKTELYRSLLADGSIPYDYWQEFCEKPTSDFRIRFWNRDFSDEGLRAIQKEAHLIFYRRPAYVLAELLRVRSLGDLRRKAAAARRLLGRRR